jgi:hypothetical protein
MPAKIGVNPGNNRKSIMLYNVKLCMLVPLMQILWLE